MIETSSSEVTGVGLSCHGLGQCAATPYRIPTKPILGFFTPSPVLIEAKPWPDAPKGLPNQPVPAILLGRLAVAATHQGKGLGAMLLATACQIASETIVLTGGIGLVGDAAHPVSTGGLRMFLPTKSLKTGVEIPRE